MAVGWDQAVADACVDLGIPFHAYVPFREGQDRFWPYDTKAHYAELLSLAAEVVYCCDGGYEPWKMQERNEQMVDACDHLLALWNGSHGGTANCVKYAKMIAKPITNCWEDWRKFK